MATLTKDQHKISRFLLRTLIILALSIVTFACIIGVFCVTYFMTLPSVTDAQAETLAILQEHHGIFMEIPTDAKVGEAIVSVEDRRFYQHHGIDSFGFLKTALMDLFTSYPNGGATIDEQLAKNLYVQNDVNWTAKVKVAFIAFKLDTTYSKQTILNMYLNAIYYGHQEYGIEQASEGYFGKKPTSLDWAEASMLAGLPQAPSYYNPIKDLSAGKFRQKLVLEALTRDGYLTAAQAQQIYAEKLVLR